MTYRTGIIGAVFGSLFSVVTFAADIPEEDIQAAQFNKQQCIDNTTQDCINSQCLNSDATDCQDQCSASAIEICDKQADE